MKRKTANIDIQLPTPGDRWTPRRKRAVIEALDAGQISTADAFERYALTPEELNAWVKMFLRHGLYGLRGTRLQYYEPERRGY
jgi:hypothetical protein